MVWHKYLHILEKEFKVAPPLLYISRKLNLKQEKFGIENLFYINAESKLNQIMRFPKIHSP